MATLNWIGKDAVANHDKEVPFKLLQKVPSASVGKESKNLIIHGDNLEALKALMPFYQGKVDCIYIDPPYNTGTEKWIYNDRVNSPKIREWLGKVVGGDSEDLARHDKWLCMMYPRLSLLKQLLTPDGVIFVSIDENEIHDLLYLMEDIFKHNIGIFSWVRKKKGSHLSSSLRKMTEYVVAYTNSPRPVELYGEQAYSDKWQPIVKRTNAFKELKIAAGVVSTKLTDGRYKKGTYGNAGTALEFLSDLGVSKGIIISPITVRARFVWTQAMLDSELGKGTLISLSQKFGFNVLRYDQSEKFKTPSTLLSPEIGIGTNEDASKELSDLFGTEMGKVFPYPKPVSLIKYLVNAVTRNNVNALILDSFAGSGTTGHAVLELNKEDGGNRQFVLVEMEDSVAKKITAERVKKAIKKSGFEGGFEYCELVKPLFDENGQINESCSYDELASYIYFTEIQTNIDKKTIKNPFIGESHGTSYYLVYAGRGKNDLTRSAIAKLQITGPAVIYADRCLVNEDELKEKGIVFKQIPYEVKVY